MTEHTEVEVLELPKCDIPGCDQTAHYDGKTKQGPWANMCEEHFQKLGVGLGLGKGQKLILIGGKEDMPKPAPVPVPVPKPAKKGGKKKSDSPPFRGKITFVFVEDVSGISLAELTKRANYVLEQFTPKSKEITLVSKECTVEEIPS